MPFTKLRDRTLAAALPVVPRRMVRRFASPYVAGATLHEALDAVRSLIDGGFATTVDVLGEAISSADEARATRDAYLAALAALAELGEPNLVNVSIKLTALGLGIDDALARANLRDIVACAKDHNGFVRIDMEDSPWTDATLDAYDALRDEGFANVGVVLQAMLRRTEADARRLAEAGAAVRLVKGIYREPAEIAWQGVDEIRASYRYLARALVEGGARVAFATHDPLLVRDARALVADQPPQQGHEFQMLLGVAEDLRDELRDSGQPVRVYVPYGSDWYAYCLRRLRENPKIAGYVTGDIVRAARRRVTGGNRSKRARSGSAPTR